MPALAARCFSVAPGKIELIRTFYVILQVGESYTERNCREIDVATTLMRGCPESGRPLNR